MDLLLIFNCFLIFRSFLIIWLIFRGFFDYFLDFSNWFDSFQGLGLKILCLDTRKWISIENNWTFINFSTFSRFFVFFWLFSWFFVVFFYYFLDFSNKFDSFQGLGLKILCFDTRKWISIENNWIFINFLTFFYILFFFWVFLWVAT